MNDYATSLAAALPGPAGLAPTTRRSLGLIDAGLDWVVSKYLAAWNAASDTDRLRHLQATWNDFGSFEDPLVRLQGRFAMNAHIAACRAARPDIRWGVTSDIAHQHGRMLFAWAVLDGQGREILVGHSYGELDAQGRIQKMVGFFSSVSHSRAGPG
jgi:hypothetical protein